MALITINLGIFNLLPVPALDGGRILFIIVEFLIRKPVPPKYEGMIHAIGFLLLILLMIYVTGNEERMVVSSQFDNLGQGASGAAIQCMNLMLGCEEAKGLNL